MEMIFVYLIFYKIRPLTDAEKEKARLNWEEFKKQLPEGVTLVGEYAHVWGTEYNGLIIVEASSHDAYHRFWHRFRETTRWYVPETKTYIAEKEE